MYAQQVLIWYSGLLVSCPDCNISHLLQDLTKKKNTNNNHGVCFYSGCSKAYNYNAAKRHLVMFLPSEL